MARLVLKSQPFKELCNTVPKQFDFYHRTLDAYHAWVDAPSKKRALEKRQLFLANLEVTTQLAKQNQNLDQHTLVEPSATEIDQNLFPGATDAGKCRVDCLLLV